MSSTKRLNGIGPASAWTIRFHGLASDKMELTASFSGILVPRCDWCEAGGFPSATFIEFGWGDRAYYPAREKTLRMTLDAALRPTPAIMYMAGRARPLEVAYGGADVVPVAMTRQTFWHMVDTFSGYFDRNEGARSGPVARGPHPHSNFYLAHGGFHLFNNCNTWTARILRAGGVNLSPAGIITAGQLMSSLRTAIAVNQPSGLEHNRRARAGEDPLSNVIADAS